MGAVRQACIEQLCVADHNNDADTIAAWAGADPTGKFTALLLDDAANLIVAVRNDTIVGLAGFSGDLVTLNYVHPDHRFMGISKALMAEVEARMQSADVIHARLYSTATAIRFYRSLGWQETGIGTSESGFLLVKSLDTDQPNPVTREGQGVD